jgi:hypothetical protein
MPWAAIYAQFGGWTVTIDGTQKFGRLSGQCVYRSGRYLEDSRVGV